MSISLEDLWQLTQPEPFTPNLNQKRAIVHTQSPLFLTAGPGSGKTRVLLWRSLNLIVFHDIKPEEVFLSTFTEKAAFQLKEGLRSLLGLVTNLTGKPYDISKMYVGTVHSLCQKLLTDRRFFDVGQRSPVPVLKDQLGQYFYLSRRRYWESILEKADFDLDIATEMINQFFNHKSSSKHNAVNNCISLFNRFSEECLYREQILERIKTSPVDNPDTFIKLVNLYAEYLQSLKNSNPPQADFSLIQQYALNFLEQSPHSGNLFKHIIIDEYQDTNSIQERIFFKLASGFKNICVVGDDDQALYRFRGATVENFVQFPSRCQEYLNCSVTEIPLNINYRSRQQIVDFYNDFITRQNWCTADGKGFYRLVNKNITAFNSDRQTAVIASTAASPESISEEIALMVRDLIKSGKVKDPNQIAFLYPSLKSKQVERMISALEDVGLKVYAPRAKRFLEVNEAIAVFGVYLLIFGKPVRGDFRGSDYNDFHQWLNRCEEIAQNLVKEDKPLGAFVAEKQQEIKTALNDYRILSEVAIAHNWDKAQPYDPPLMKRQLVLATGISDAAKKNLGNVYFDRLVEQKIATKQPCTLGYVINASTSLDWSVLDLFYRLCIFNHFKEMFDVAERGSDEGPICNMGLISQYLARFTDEYTHIITAQFLEGDRLQVTFFMGFLYSLFRLGETEYEDQDDPFPKGRIPFLTIHQSKGLEFPVVILGNPRKDPKLQRVEEIVKPVLDRHSEPLERMAEFDVMRMFYVALSRAKNLLVIAHLKGTGQKLTFPFNEMLNDGTITRISDFDLNSLPEAQESTDDLPKNYSYTSDYLLYQRCPRQYMIFRKYGFVASRSQTMFFGSVVHKTIEDLHYLLKARKAKYK